VSKLIYRSDYLKLLWMREFPEEKRLFNLITRTNYPFIHHDGVSSTAIITPQENGFGVAVTSAEVTESNISVELEALGSASNIDVGLETKLRLVAIVLLANPLDDRNPKFNLFSVVSQDLPPQITDPVTINIANSSNHSERVAKYQQSQAFFALVTLDNDDNIISYSSTFKS